MIKFFSFCRKSKGAERNGNDSANPQHQQQLPKVINDTNNLVLSGIKPDSGFHSLQGADMGIVAIATPQRPPEAIHYIGGPTITEIIDNGIDAVPQ